MTLPAGKKSGDKAKPKPKPKPKDEPKADDAGDTKYEQCTVTGRITGVKAGKVTVAAGKGGKLTFELADNAAVDVNSSDYTLAKQGDSIEISHGFKLGNNISIGEAKITLSQPLTGPHKKKPAAPATHPKKPADGGADAPDK